MSLELWLRKELNNLDLATKADIIRHVEDSEKLVAEAFEVSRSMFENDTVQQPDVQ